MMDQSTGGRLEFLADLLREKAELTRMLSVVDASIMIYAARNVVEPARPVVPHRDRAMPPEALANLQANAAKASAARGVPSPPSPPIPLTDLGPAVEASFERIMHWAAARGIQFSTWDDLPTVNERREALYLPIFRPFSRRPATTHNESP